MNLLQYVSLNFDPKLFFSTFGLIFIAELPDKTALATLLLATRNRGLPVFIGVGGAFLIQSLVAVTFGQSLSLLPHSVTQIGASILFFIFAILMWRKPSEDKEASKKNSSDPTSFLSTFQLTLVLPVYL